MNEKISESLIAYKLITALFKQGEISEDLYRKVSQLYFQGTPQETPYPC